MIRNRRKSKRKVEPRVNWWKLKEAECRRNFNRELQEVLSSTTDVLEAWAELTERIRETAKTVLGVTSNCRKPDKETWWWNEAVHESIQNKKKAKKVVKYEQNETC